MQQLKLVGAVLAASTLLPSCTKTELSPSSAPTEASSGVTAAENSRLAANAAVDPGNADAAFNAFNNAFLVNSGGKTYYKKSVNDGNADGTWVASLDIMVAEDAYERTGSAAHKTLVNNLCNTWLQNTPPP